VGVDCADIVSPSPLQNTSGSVNLQIVQISRHDPCAALRKVTIVKNHAAGVSHADHLVGAVVLPAGSEALAIDNMRFRCDPPSQEVGPTESEVNKSWVRDLAILHNFTPLLWSPLRGACRGRCYI